MRRLAAALLPAAALAAFALTAPSPAAAAPSWVTDSECTGAGGKVTPVGRGKAVCQGGTYANELIHFDNKKPAGNSGGGGGLPLSGGPAALLGGLLG
ncbi:MULTISPECIES: hypothetical protein [unclassified Nonomuraea]|uniref:hypothetical protein n=1 Tax=Nonomuraea sp. NPDC047529 TaxID=3155623 RepID=UPI0033ED089D